jgi:xanthine/uracil permease
MMLVSKKFFKLCIIVCVYVCVCVCVILQSDLSRVVQSALFVSAINTLLQTLLGSRLPAVMGNSFYFLSITLSIVNAPSIIDIPDPHERFRHAMRATQGAFIAGSALNIILGFSGLWGLFVR